MDPIIKADIEDIVGRIDVTGLRGKKILITGSNGLFGTYIVNLIAHLNLRYDYKTKIYCISLNPPKKDLESLAKKDKNIVFISCDLSESFTFRYKIDYIFHAACYAQPQKFIKNSLKTIRLNVSATELLLQIAKKNSASFLFFSSAEIYGNIPKNQVPVAEDYNGNLSTTDIRSVYGESKRLGETVCSIYAREAKIKTHIVRISHVYGPGVSVGDERVISEFIQMALTERRILLKDGGNAVKTWGYVSDILVMILNVMLNGNELVYNVGGVDSRSIKEIASKIGDITKSKVVIPRVSSRKFSNNISPAIVKLDISRYVKEFGPTKFTSLEKGIGKTIEWYSDKVLPK